MSAGASRHEPAPDAAALRRARRFRLPGTVRPNEVDVAVEVDPARSRAFSGRVSMQLVLERGSRTLVLHAVELEIGEARARVGDGHWPGQVEVDALREIVRIRFERTLPRGPVQLELRFAGRLRDDLLGLHRIDTGGRHFAFSQLCTTRARCFFPCFDEPGFKARYRLSVTTAAHYEVVSNMPAERTETLGDGRVTVDFQRTPPLSTYLLALAVGELEISRSVHAGPTEIRVVATPGKTRLAELALEVARRALPVLEQWFEMPYPYPKLDLVAVPQFSFGAMENAGAVFFRETLLLADPEQLSFEERKRLTETICHELAHMWFGDLVTMAWWDDLWLNESFATWMAFHVVDVLHPEWSSWQAFGHRKDAALALDALAHTHPVYCDVKSAEEADENFDLITYEKGAAVIRMLAGYLGHDAFRRGVQAYVRAHVEGNATAADLWAALEEVSDVPVARIMRAWIEQAGHPRVKIGRAERAGRHGFVLEQALHRTVAASAGEGASTRDTTDASGPLWPIPWIGHVGGGDDEEPRMLRHLLEARSEFVAWPGAHAPAWIYGNGDEAGFHRPWHAEADTRALRAAPQRLSPVERQGWVGHEWALVQAGLLEIDALLATTLALAGDPGADVLEAIEVPLGALGRGLVHDLAPGTAQRYRGWVARTFTPALEAIGHTTKPGDDDGLRRRRAQLLGLVALVGESEAHLALARALAPRILDGRERVDPELVSVWLLAAARHGDVTLHEAFAEATRTATTPQARQRALFALTEFSDPELIARSLDRCTHGQVANQDLVFVLGRCLAHPAAQAATWAFIQAHWKALAKVLPPYHAPRLIAATPALRHRRFEREVLHFFRALALPSTRRALQQARERFAGHAQLRAHAGPDLERWLSERAALE
jgi:puromycin-sensitive aminopeptidase